MMGLECVEIVMAVEEHYGIDFPDEFLEEIRTPGDFANLVLKRLDPEDVSQPVGCKSQRGFYQLRRALRLHFGVPRDKIRPEVPLVELIGPITKTNWEKLDWTARFLGGIHSLSFSKPQSYFLLALVPVGLLAIALKLPVLFLVNLLLFLSAFLVFLRIKRTLPNGIRTVADLVPFVNLPYRGPLDRDQVLAEIIEISAEQLGVKPELIREDSRYFEDLHWG